LKPLPRDLAALLRASGARISGSREIQHATQYQLERGSESVRLNLYSTGKALIQGKKSGLKELLDGWNAGRGGKRGVSRERRKAPSPVPVPNETPRIGIDEAGKGDYFGPLVVAGVRILGGEIDRELRELGVRDSKDLLSGEVTRLAGRILEVLGWENVQVISLSPKEFESRRASAGNVNVLLAELDAEILYQLKGEVEVAVIDEFARSAGVQISRLAPAGMRLEVRVRAEDDVAVAAAAVLARARFLEEMDRLSGVVGFELPKGATHVVGAGRRVFRERGMKGLEEVAKVSFRTTGQIVGGKR
jgi:ribonuclease HIII